MSETRFSNLLDLARLPYFEVKDGALVLADAALGPAIDVHTHLALAYVRRMSVDLGREWPETEHYLPPERAIDLDVYANRNFTPEDLRRLNRDLTLLSVTAGGMRRTHTLPNLRREMGGLGVRQSVLLAIDFPVLSDNAGAWLEAARGAKDIVVFGSVHPFRRGVERELDRQVALGARGIKVHPAVQNVRPDMDAALRLYRACARRGLPVFFHCGPVDIEPPLGRWLSQVRFYERGIAECPETTFVLGHSGALQMPEALALARRYPNVWMETSSQSLSGVRRVLAEGPPDRLTFGSDWPFYPVAVPLAKVLLATEGDDALRRAVLHGNATRLLGIAA
jgi:predicted TIM-barrel fold metal-dependent hydrolase